MKGFSLFRAAELSLGDLQVHLALGFSHQPAQLFFHHFYQAFLEMASEEAAVTMVNYYTSAQPSIRSQPVYIQFSNHRELKTDNMTTQVRSSSSGPAHCTCPFV